ncbi:MAG: hypothetical protein AVDCRST_MAG83-1967 [uncultured Arthrobacter sp.]|uniref:DUF3052 domain-containing protein n=2 Tax=Arthrobacter TaxID=1663 RepID=A0A4V3AMR4_9MICC|nr:DUF3052 domain-containing protein [Arthrobacter crusticola]TDK27784.1 DUF3052 domain-containing protein [Arthrobacter crusticola]CAA9247130.1 MAG: hypothetical protein AVDCRST_MAG83-1967 [uncultured Arthrobacter sp.]
MSEAEAATAVSVAGKLGFKTGDLVQELGYDEDVDFDFRDALEADIGSELLMEDDQDVVDGVILWWRNNDGDLVDALVDALVSLGAGGVIWVLTPKPGREGYVAPSEIQEAAPTAGLHSTSSAGVSKEWAATRLVSRRKQ